MGSYRQIVLIIGVLLTFSLLSPGHFIAAFDTEVSRSSLSGLQGVAIEV